MERDFTSHFVLYYRSCLGHDDNPEHDQSNDRDEKKRKAELHRFVRIWSCHCGQLGGWKDCHGPVPETLFCYRANSKTGGAIDGRG